MPVDPPPPEQILQNVPFPHKLEVTRSSNENAENWSHFKSVWSFYEIASRLSTHPSEIRVATMLSCFSKEALKVYTNCRFTLETYRKDITKVLQALDNYFVGEHNETYESYIFNKRVQEKDEPIESYVTALTDLAKYCNFENLHDRLIKDRIVIGTNHNDVRKRLLATKDLTLEKAIDIARAQEATMNHMKDMAVPEDVSYVSKKKTVGECKYCCKRHVFLKSMCPAWGKKCSSCKGSNHFQNSNECPNKTNISQPSSRYNKTKNPRNTQNQHVAAIDNEDSDGDTEHGYQCVYACDQLPPIPNKLYARMQLCGEKDVNFQMDCGATVSVIPLTMLKSLSKPPPLKDTTVILRMYNGSTITPEGEIMCKTVNVKNNAKYMVRYIVVKENCRPILGAKAIQAMSLMAVNVENVMYLGASELLETFPSVFAKGVGTFDGEVTLKIDQSIPPVKMPPRKLPLAIKDEVKDHIDDLVKTGVLIPVDTPTDWVSGMVVVKKPSGKIRLCIDPKPINKALKRSDYPLPTLQDVLPDLSKAVVFSVADVQNGY